MPACQRSVLRGGLVSGKLPMQDSRLFSAQSACLQNIEIQTESGTSFYQLVYDATSDLHQLVILSAVGQRLATVTQNGRKVTVQKSLPERLAVSPRELLLSMQLIHWPVPVLESGMLNSEWQINEDNSTRYVHKGDKMLAKIVYHNFHECRGTIEYIPAGGDSLYIDCVPF